MQFMKLCSKINIFTLKI